MSCLNKMLNIFLLCSIIVAAVLQPSNAYCCLNYRDPLVLKTPCDFEPSPTGVVNCGCLSCSGDFSLCQCSLPVCNCFKDTDNICATCETNKSPVCSCLSSLGSCPCNCDGKRSFIYFPEVDYPVTIIEMQPEFYYSTCFYN